MDPKEKLIKYIDLVNDGDWVEVSLLFNDIRYFLEIINRHGLFDLLEWKDENCDELRSQILRFMIGTNHKEEAISYIVNQLTDVSFEDGKYFLNLDEKNDIVDLFEDNLGSRRSSQSVNTILFILNDDNYELFSDFDDNIYWEMVNDILSPSSLTELSHAIYNEIKSKEIPAETRALAALASKQGYNGFVILTPELIEEIIVRNRENTDYILDYAPEIKSSLYRLYFDTYNSISISSIWDHFINELSTYFVRDTILNGIINTYKLEILDFEGKIKAYLSGIDNYWHNTIEYFGRYLSVLKNAQDHELKGFPRLYVNSDDVDPDYLELSVEINDNFTNFI